jgi:hypothetical protein
VINWYQGNLPHDNLPPDNLLPDNLPFFQKNDNLSPNILPPSQIVARQIAVLSYLSRDKIGVFYNIGPYK